MSSSSNEPIGKGTVGDRGWRVANFTFNSDCLRRIEDHSGPEAQEIARDNPSIMDGIAIEVPYDFLLSKGNVASIAIVTDNHKATVGRHGFRIIASED